MNALKKLSLMVAASLAMPALHAAEEREESAKARLDEMVIKGERPGVPANVPSTVGSVTAKQIEETINTVTSAGALQYLPSVHVRERYVGDVNGVLVMRVNSSVSSAQTTVYADGMLLSNFLNNSFSTAPRWGMVSPNEIERIDVIYGPFSALFPGNSAGGVVSMTTRMPRRFEAQIKFDAFGQRYKEYGTNDKFLGGHIAASLGDKVGKWSWLITGDHLDNEGHPQTFVAAAPKAASTLPAAIVTPGTTQNTTIVTGALNDIDTANLPRVTTASSGADHSVQDIGKFKVAYDITSSVRAAYSLGVWQSASDKKGESYLRDAAGNVIYGTRAVAGPYRYLRINGVDYTVTAPPTSRAESEHFMHGLSLKSDTGGMWDWQLIGSLFRQNKEQTRTSGATSGTTASEDSLLAGTYTQADGTGWRNLDVRGDLRPSGNRDGMHQLSFGAHVDRYNLKSDTFNLAAGDWRSSAIVGAATATSRGKTETRALYLQDVVQFNPATRLVAGLRVENWKASEGGNNGVFYPESSKNATSPKLSLSYQARPDLALRASYGLGTRFPTVSELFANLTIRNAAGVSLTNFATLPAPYNTVRNDGNLKPEAVNSWDFTAEKLFAKGILRASLFGEEKRDALINQTDITTLPSLDAALAGYTISSVQNVDKVRTYGLETALELNDWWIQGLDFSGSVTYAHSKIVANAKVPGLVGTDQPRIPDWRATLVGTYRPSPELAYTLSYRFSGRQHNGLFNTATNQYNDPNPDVYGAVSHYSVFDVKAHYKVSKNWAASLGINNLGNFKYYVNPNPYPQRTYYASLKYDY
ncbi:MAG: TonB-dependent receptor [Usitatibacteraceae bacterium]